MRWAEKPIDSLISLSWTRKHSDFDCALVEMICSRASNVTRPKRIVPLRSLQNNHLEALRRQRWVIGFGRKDRLD